MKPIYINGIKTRYMITEDGNVFNKDKGKFLKLRLSRVGYYTVHLRMTALGINKLCQVHRLVAKAFIPNPLDLPQVNHKNGIKTDNRVENLEWVTAQENTIHAYKTGLAHIRCGEDSGNSKYSNSQIERVCELLDMCKYTNNEISIMCNIPERLVSNIRRGELWKSISSKYKNIKKKEYRFAKFHEFVDYLIFMNKSTSEILHILMNNEGLKEKESRDLINNRRKALKKKKLRIEFV